MKKLKIIAVAIIFSVGIGIAAYTWGMPLSRIF